MPRLADHKTETGLNRRLFMQAGVSAGALALMGCSTGEILTGSRARAAAAAPEKHMGRSLIAVTTRKPVDGADASPWFGPERSGGTRAVRVRFAPTGGSLVNTISTAVKGKWRIEKVEALGHTDPLASLVGEADGRDVLLYVHGFNESFESAVLGGAELADDIGFQGRTVIFSWPSKDALLDYGYDRESAMWSRDAFQDVLEALVRSGMTGRVHIVAHSMGCMLTLETLRQLWLADASPDVAAKFGAIVFASPDIDIDVFAATLPRIGPLAKHLTVITSTSDRALAVSRQLAGGVSRVGAAQRARLEPLGVKVVDASGYGWGLIGHDLFLSNADVRDVVKRSIERAQMQRGYSAAYSAASFA